MGGQVKSSRHGSARSCAQDHESEAKASSTVVARREARIPRRRFPHSCFLHALWTKVDFLDRPKDWSLHACCSCVMQNASAAWLRVSLRGFCDTTVTGGGCNGKKGSFSIHESTWPAAVEHCLSFCQRCASCKYVSISVVYGDCSWFSFCDVDSLRNDVHGFRTAPVEATAQRSWRRKITSSPDLALQGKAFHELWAPAPVNHVAMLLSGSLARLGGALREDVWTTLGTHVVDVLERTDGSSRSAVTSFLCIDGAASKPSPSAVARLRIAKTIHRDYPLLRENSSFLLQAQRWKDCFLDAALEHEQREQMPFSFFVRLRPDVWWFADMLPLSALSKSAVTSRARMLHGGSEPLLVTVDHMTHFESGCNEWPLSSSCVSARGPACVVVDDQFAIVPRPLAWAYFTLTRPPRHLGPSSSPEENRQRHIARADDQWPGRARHTRPGGNTSHAILGHHLWGSSSRPGSPCELCTVCHSKAWPHCNEFELTNALTDLHVPLDIAPFRFRIHPAAKLPGYLWRRNSWYSPYVESLNEINHPINRSC